jgi:hypothetical protein
MENTITTPDSTLPSTTFNQWFVQPVVTSGYQWFVQPVVTTGYHWLTIG